MTATSKKVLVVDDEDVVCRSYERVLTRAGFEVCKAHSGPEALEEVEKHDYDVMLADLKMPGMDGLQVVEKLRGRHPNMPVVVITGYPSQDTLHRAARLGVTDYLTKPVAPDVLTQATAQALAANWSESATTPLTTQLPEGDETTPARMQQKLPVGPVVWPEQPVAPPARPAAAVGAAPIEARTGPAPAAAPPAPTRGRLDTAARLAMAPIVSLGYVLFLPFLGFAMFLGLGSKALMKKLGGRM